MGPVRFQAIDATFFDLDVVVFFFFVLVGTESLWILCASGVTGL